MIYTILAGLWVLGFLTFGSFWFLKIKGMPDGLEKDMFALRLVQKQFLMVLRLSRVDVSVEGKENLPKDGEAVLYVANHRSFFDTVIGYTLVDHPTGFIAKTEIEKVVTLKMWMKLLHCLFLDRENLRQNLKVILEAIAKVKKGISIWIFPEGTRSKGEDQKDMLPFKEGSFKIAQKTGCKIIPIAFLRTRDVLEAHFPCIHPTRVKVKIGEPILISELPEEDAGRIGELTRERIIHYIDEMEKAEKEEAV